MATADATAPLHPTGRLGPFQTSRRIAAGGMATVYEAIDTRDGSPLAGRPLAIKVLHDHLAGDDDFVRMFRDEGRLAMLLDHPSIVRVHDVGFDEGRHYLVMDRIDGRNLAQILEAFVSAAKPLPRAATVAVLRAVLAALDYAHNLKGSAGRPLGLVHRDISPHNILVARDERVYLTDFGIARGEHRSDRTRTGTIKGKLHYMSPEQARGGRVDERADLYAVGVVAYELLTNQPLHPDEKTVALQARVASGQIDVDDAALRRLPEDLRAWLVRAIRPERDERYASAQAMAAALEQTKVASSARFKQGTLARLLDAGAAQADAPRPQLLFAQQDLVTPRQSRPQVRLPDGLILTPQRPISGQFVGVNAAAARASRVGTPAGPDPEPARAAAERGGPAGSRSEANPVRIAEAQGRRVRRQAVASEPNEAERRAAEVALQAAGGDAAAASPPAPSRPEVAAASAAPPPWVAQQRQLAFASTIAWGCAIVLLTSILLEVWNAQVHLPRLEERPFIALREQVLAPFLSTPPAPPLAPPSN